MKLLYLDCKMGAAGDMLAAALLELLDNQDDFLDEINSINIPRVLIKKESSVKCGITGTHLTVTVDGQTEESSDLHGHSHDHSHSDVPAAAHSHAHNGLQEIHNIIDALNVPETVRKDILSVYNLIAQAESHAHGVPVSDIHFHEVGTMDAIADIAAVCLLMHKLAPDEVIVSPIHVGSGHVKCSHGILPVPAPATAYILRNVPIYGGGIRGELCTPTGAALIKHFATRFDDMPVMRTHAIGYGMGTKDFAALNCVRALLGETDSGGDTVSELCCNLDDMTAEEIGFAMDALLNAGALDVYTIPLGMKKSRPGILFCVICKQEQEDNILHLIFKHTSTLGVRKNITKRYTLERTVTNVLTPMGEVRQKLSKGYGVTRVKYEYDDIARIAREKDLSLAEVIKKIETAD